MFRFLPLLAMFAACARPAVQPAAELNVDNVKRVMKGGGSAYNGFTVETGDLKEGVHDVQRVAYAELYEGNGDAGASELVLLTGQWSQWVDSTVGLYTGGATPSATTDNITIGANGAGVYHVAATSSVVGPNNAIFRAAVFITGARRGDCQSAVRTTGGTEDTEGISVGCLVTLSAGDTLDLRFSSDGDNTLVINRINFHISRIN
jgi:hypothetical protein